MRWQISYRKKGDSGTLTMKVDLQHEDVSHVRTWFNNNKLMLMSQLNSPLSNCKDFEFIDAKKMMS